MQKRNKAINFDLDTKLMKEEFGENTATVKKVVREYLKAVRKNKWQIINRLSLDEYGMYDILVIKCGNCFCTVAEYTIEEKGKYVRILDDYLEMYANEAFTVIYEIALDQAEMRYKEALAEKEQEEKGE